MSTQFVFVYAASSKAQPLGIWTLAGILAVAFVGILIAAIAATTWLDRHRHSDASSAREVTWNKKASRR